MRLETSRSDLPKPTEEARELTHGALLMGVGPLCLPMWQSDVAFVVLVLRTE